MINGELAEMAEIASLSAVRRRRKGKCPTGERRVKRTDGVFVCVKKKPCPAGYRFNAKNFICQPTKKLTRLQPTGPTGLIPSGQVPVAPRGFDQIDSGYDFDQTGIPDDVYVPPGGGQGPVNIDPWTGQPYPGFGAPGTGSVGRDRLTGQACVLGQSATCMPLDPQTGQQPTGPSALYPFGPQQQFPGQFPGFQPNFGGGFPMPGAAVQFDTAGGGADFGEGGGGDDFIPSDAQINLTPPGIPQPPFTPSMPSFEGGDAEAASEEFQSGGTEEAAYQPEEGMEGLAEGEAPVSPLATTIVQYRDIALDTAERFRDVLTKPKTPKPPKPPKSESSNNTWLWLALGAGLGFLAYRQYKNKK